MANLTVSVGDETGTVDATGRHGAPVERQAHRVIAEAGIFKNGRTYKKGQEVELDQVTAERAIKAGDVEEI